MHSLLITNDLAAYGQADIAKTDMVVSISNDGKFFTIYKSRYGVTSNGGPGFPISVLPQVLMGYNQINQEA
jgi:hypothetical protein